MEILSPVGAKEQLIAAVRSGADAVYLGTQNFNARRNADNFDNESLLTAIEYCHARGVKVYITFNTIVTNFELKSAAEEIEKLAKYGVDAIIVQDLAVYRLIKQIVPEMPIHASTQMSIHNVEGAKILEQMGFSRIVPARELSANELKSIRQATNLELEVFVHGALCMSVSGQCYLSSVLGQRSANRGLCAQPCRLNFKSQNGEYALSLKDLSIINKINELKNIGIDSLKIEGRMKRPEYVAAATNACKSAILRKEFDENTLKAIFSRSGFTDGYFTAKRDRNMFGYRTKDDVVSAAPVLKQIANSYRKEVPLVAVDMDIEIKYDTDIKLSVSDGINTVTVKGETPQKAINREVDFENVKRALEKCGGTPFYLKDLRANINNGLSVSMSELNRLRKQALEKLLNIRSKIKSYDTFPFNFESEFKNRFVDNQFIIARFENAKQICDEADRVILDYKELLNNSWLCQKYSNRVIAELPALLFDPNNIENDLAKLKELGVDTIYAPNIYAVSLAKRLDFKILGGFGLNIINSIALDEYRKLGLTMAEISFESTIDMFNSTKRVIPCGLIVYGKMPLMTFRNCPAKTLRGCQNCDGNTKIYDRYQNEITILCKNKQYSRLLNPMPIYIGDKKSQLKNVDFLTLYFTDESKEECRKIIDNVKKSKPFENNFTRGLYYKEIK